MSLPSCESLCVVSRGALQAVEDKAGGCEAQQSRLQFCLAEAQAELADSRSRLAETSNNHCAELAARAHAAAQLESALAHERAVLAKLSAEVSELKSSQSSLQVCSRLIRWLFLRCTSQHQLSLALESKGG